jgi:hypothetical protein
MDDVVIKISTEAPAIPPVVKINGVIFHIKD